MSVRPSSRCGLAPDLLRRHVGRRPRDLAPAQPLDLLVDRQAEVADPRLAPQIEQDVRGLQVAVHQMAGVRVGVVQRLGDKGHDPRIRRTTGDGPDFRSSSKVSSRLAPRRTRARCSRRPRARAPLAGRTRRA